VCQQEIVDKDRVVYNHRETFVFKPANVPDIEISTPGAGGVEILRPGAAVLSPEELRESRKQYTRTEVATTYGVSGEVEIPEGAFGLRHQDCVRVTGSTMNRHAQNKHAVRWRSAAKRH
jgi:hypothetical protein